MDSKTSRRGQQKGQPRSVPQMARLAALMIFNDEFGARVPREQKLLGPGKPGIRMAIDAVEKYLDQHGASVNKAAAVVASYMVIEWKFMTMPVQRTRAGAIVVTKRRRPDLERLNPETLPERLRRAYYHRQSKN